jgi:predicted dienelactone hydrolase
MLRAVALAAVITGVLATPASAQVSVGHTIKRIEVPGLAPGEIRQVDVHLWYPANAQDAAARPKTVYTSALYGKAMPNGWAPLSWKIEAATAREGAAFDASGGQRYAPIVFSHGASNDPFDYADTLEAIARAGFIVAAPTHTNNTQDDVRLDYINALAGTRLFPCQDGLPARTVPTLTAAGSPNADCAKASVPNSMSDRARDVSAVLDALPGWFGNAVDVQRAGVMGHSRGTITALAAAGGSVPWGTAGATCAPAQPPDGLCWQGVRREPRVKAIMGMAIGAAAINNGVNLASITTPTLLINADRDRNTVPANTQAAFDAIPATTDKTHIEVAHAVHRSFDSDYCAEMQAAGAAFDTDHDGTVSAAEAANTGRPLDRWNLDLIAASFPGFISGKAVHYCAAGIFTGPVNIKRLVAATANAEYACPDAGTDATCGWVPATTGPPVQAGVCDPGVTAPPCTGRDTDEVKEQIIDTAVRFFLAKLGRVAGGDVSGTVPATLSLTLGPPVSFGAFTPGVAQDYLATTSATVISTAGDATLAVADPDTTATGHLVNGAFSLPQALQARANTGTYAPVGGSSSPTALLTYTGPVSNDKPTLGFKQPIAAGDALRTGTYNKTLTFTLSTTTP